MKKLSLLLVLVMLITVILVSCGGGSVETSRDISSGESHVNESEEESDESSESESSADESSTVDEPEDFDYATVVSSGKAYTASITPGEQYPDSYGTELTDGLFATAASASYSDTKLVGYAPGSESGCTIIVDLGEVMSDLYEFRVSYLCTSIAGIAPPNSIYVYISSDNEKWERQGRCSLATYEADTMKLAVLTLNRSVSARYVKFIVNKDSAWIFLDEVMVVANIPSGDARAEWVAAINQRYNMEELTFDQRSEALKAISGEKADRSLYRTNIAKGCSYTANGEIDTSHPDKSNTLLTDGKISRYLEGETWVGYKGGAEMEIIVTFSSAKNNISGFELYAYNNQITGISFPCSIIVSVSTDKTAWTEVGRVYAPSDNGQGIFTYVLELDYEITAKYVKFTLTETDCDVFYIEEVAVIAYTEEPANITLYPVIVMPEVTKDEYWPSSDSDYNDTINLISGLTQQISCASSVEEDYWSNNTPVTSTLMTDGKYSASTDIHNGLFFKFNRGDHRDIIYNITKLSSLSSFKASFTNISSWAVYAPSYVSVYLSADGRTWYSAGIMTLDTTKDPGVVQGTLTLDFAVEARFVCFAFDMGAWAGCDELEVIGTKKVSSSVKKLENSGFSVKEKFMTGEYMAPDESLLGGVEDLYLVYHSTSVKRGSADLLPALAYIDENGDIKDTMFDGFLFLLSGSLSSGYGGYNGFTKSDGEWLISTLFADGCNINALEEAAGQVKTALGNSDYKYKFYITLYYPKTGSNFGDIDGDGKNEVLNTLEERLAAVEWYMSLFEEELAKKDYKNIEFCGYYWYHEAASAENGDMELINGVSELTHSHDSQLFWIPYYVAPGYSLWAEHGFDVACMQPNYAFKLDRPISNIINTANLAKRYGMGVEIEIDSKALTNDLYLQRYMTYLEYGVYYGYINDCIHMYYMSFYDLNNACASESPRLRLIYDYTYQFIKGTLNITPDTVDTISANASKDTPCASTLNPEGVDIKLYKINVSPSHGTVTINIDGTFTYYPDKGYTGTDEFYYVYSEYLGYSEPCLVTINVN
ncbi:MAG: DUF4855 domain-containing protein [Eubacteriales bacterium]|nr:DUF4855 domain-containing protein [Eubacteriales bacterium]